MLRNRFLVVVDNIFWFYSLIPGLAIFLFPYILIFKTYSICPILLLQLAKFLRNFPTPNSMSIAWCTLGPLRVDKLTGVWEISQIIIGNLWIPFFMLTWPQMRWERHTSGIYKNKPTYPLSLRFLSLKMVHTVEAFRNPSIFFQPHRDQENEWESAYPARGLCSFVKFCIYYCASISKMGVRQQIFKNFGFFWQNRSIASRKPKKYGKYVWT